MAKFKGLKKAVSAMPTPSQANFGCYVQIDYDKKANEILIAEHCDLGKNWHTYYNDENVINVGDYAEKVTMKKLEKDIIIAIKIEEQKSELIKAGEYIV